MPSLTVWHFPTPLGVDAGELALRRLVEEDAITVHDAVTAIWMPGAEHPDIRRVRHRTAGAAGRGAFWGALVGTLFLAPGVGAAAGAGTGAVLDRLRRGGVGDGTIEELRSLLTPGTSALFVLSSDARPEAVRRALAGTEATLVHAEMDEETEAELRRMLGPDAAP